MLIPKGLKEKEDFIIAYEQLIHGVQYELNSDLGKSLPELKNIDWLSSIIAKDGNWVWYKEPLVEKDFKLPYPN